MSRICVKNLPKHVAEDRLKHFFSQKGEVTDAKLMKTTDGKSRQFCFIGYRTEQEAQEALKYFNNSYLDTSRITCEIARKVGDTGIPRPWSRHSLKKEEKSTKEGKKGTDAKSTKGSKGGKNFKKGNENDDPRLQEFLQVMQPRSKAKLWANDSLGAPPKDFSSEKQILSSKSEVKAKSVSSQVDLGKNDGKNVLIDGQRDDQSGNLAREDVISDMDYFKSRIKKEWSDSESGDDDGGGGGAPLHDTIDRDVGPVEVSGGEMVNAENPLTFEDEREENVEVCRLFIRNLPYAATEDDLEELFSKLGNVSQVHLVVDKDTKRSKGIAYVLYALPESAERALEELDNTTFQGRLLHVMPAKQKNPSVQQEVNLATKTFKQKREEERKASEASGNTRAWNSLFMHPDTVVENIARKYGVSKTDFLDREADDLAVRIALGETQVIADTKKAFLNAGVSVAALEEFASGNTDCQKRSNHVLLVKNLPYTSSESELIKMFGKFGSIDKIVLPPTKTMALAVFLEAAEARAAFKGLAYKRYKDVPLYLEWAPDNILNQSPSEITKNNAVVGEEDAKKVLLEQTVEGLSDVDIDPDRVESRSLFVKNLNFRTSDESLRNHFSELLKEGMISSVKVKKHLKNGKNVSMGFGFVEFDSVETATNAYRDLQGTVLDSHALILQFCRAKKDEVVKKGSKDLSSTKLIVRNVAFEATQKDLRQLFSPFGQIKSLRLPMKFGSHRGFAFVEYVTKQETQNALAALSNTHLYGRHLVLERAKEGESLEELRARTAAQFADEENGYQNPTKLSKKRKHMNVLDEGAFKFQRIAD